MFIIRKSTYCMIDVMAREWCVCQIVIADFTGSVPLIWRDWYGSIGPQRLGIICDLS